MPPRPRSPCSRSAAASLAIPLILIRRHWVASSMPAADGSTAPVWGGVSVWWAAYLTAWATTGLSTAVLGENWNNADEAVGDLLLAGLLEVASAIALAVAAAMMIRIMFRINAMQDAMARAVAQSRPRRERREIAPMRGPIRAVAVRVVRGHEPDRDAVLPELCERTTLVAPDSRLRRLGCLTDGQCGR